MLIYRADRTYFILAYLSVPTRPPTEKSVHAPDEATLNRIFQMINEKVDHLELLTGYEGNAFASTGDAVEDLLSITSVHPMRTDAVRELLSRAGADWRLVERLLADGRLMETAYDGRKFYVRRIRQGSGKQ